MRSLCVHNFQSKREGRYCGKSGKVSGMYCGKFIARSHFTLCLYTRVPLPHPLTHTGWYHGSTHIDTNFFFEVGHRSNLSPLTPLSAILPPLLLFCFFFTATTAAVLLFLRRPAVATGASSSFLLLVLRRRCCWCFFFFSTSSSSSFVQYGFDDSYIYI